MSLDIGRLRREAATVAVGLRRVGFCPPGWGFKTHPAIRFPRIAIFFPLSEKNEFSRLGVEGGVLKPHPGRKNPTPQSISRHQMGSPAQ